MSLRRDHEKMLCFCPSAFLVFNQKTRWFLWLYKKMRVHETICYHLLLVILRSTRSLTIFPTWFVVDLNGRRSKSSVLVLRFHGEKSHWWFGRPQSAAGIMIFRIVKWNHVVEYLVSQNVDVAIPYRLHVKKREAIRYHAAFFCKEE